MCFHKHLNSSQVTEYELCFAVTDKYFQTEQQVVSYNYISSKSLKCAQVDLFFVARSTL